MPGVEDGVAALGHEEHAEVGLTGQDLAREIAGLIAALDAPSDDDMATLPDDSR